MKGRRPKYVLKLPLEKTPILQSPTNVVPIPSQPLIAESTPSQPSIDQPMPSQPPIVQPMPSQPPIVILMQPNVNESIPSFMASQCARARLTSLSSPSGQNDSPTSIPSRLVQNVLQEVIMLIFTIIQAIFH